jgi:two-component system LytT family response regulator
MNLTCLVIDDEPHAIRVLSGYIQKTPGLELAGTATNPLDTLELFTGSCPPGLTFLDIDMPELSGLDLAGMVGRQTRVVFTTSYRQYGPEAFEQGAAGYLLKPVSYERFLNCIHQLRQLPPLSVTETASFFVKTEMKGKMVRVDIGEIRYISAMGNYVEIHLGGHEKIIAYLTLNEVFGRLPAGQFYRIQRSVIVAAAYLRSIEHFQVRLTDRTVLPVGKTYSAAFLAALSPSLLISKRDL